MLKLIHAFCLPSLCLTICLSKFFVTLSVTCFMFMLALHVAYCVYMFLLFTFLPFPALVIILISSVPHHSPFCVYLVLVSVWFGSFFYYYFFFVCIFKLISHGFCTWIYTLLLPQA